MAKLLLMLPGVGDVLHDVEKGNVLIGRLSDNTLQIDDRSVALHHARITWTDGVFKLRDLTSGNRTWVNGVPIFELNLTERCLVRFGDIEGIFVPVAEGEFWENTSQLRAHLTTLAADRDALVEQLQPLQAENARLHAEHAALEARVLESTQQRAGYEHTNEHLSRQLIELRHEKEMIAGGAVDPETVERLHTDLRSALAKIAALEGALNNRESRLSAAENQREQVSATTETLSAALAAVHHDAEAMRAQWEHLLAGLEHAKAAGAELFRVGSGGTLISRTGRAPVSGQNAASAEPMPLSEFYPRSEAAQADSPEAVRERLNSNIKAAVEAMATAAKRLTANSYDRIALNELFSGARSLALRADASENLSALRRMASTLEALLGDLCKIPEQLDAARLRTIERAIEMLRLLMHQDRSGAANDLLKATICVVSDDAEEPMIAATRLVDFDLSIMNYPTERIDAVADQACEVIILDPGPHDKSVAISCERVRRFPRHRQTPVILLISTSESDEDDPKTIWPASECNHVLTKPFNPYEMAAQILLCIFERRLAPAPPGA